MTHTPAPARSIQPYHWLLLAVVVFQVGMSSVMAQRVPPTGPAPAVSVQVDVIPTFARTRLGQIDELLADHQWPEAVDALRDLVRDHGDQLVAVSGNHDGWWIPLRTHVERKIAHGPAEALAEYRRAVDPLVEITYQQAVDQRDRAALARIAEEWFASS